MLWGGHCIRNYVRNRLSLRREALPKKFLVVFQKIHSAAGAILNPIWLTLLKVGEWHNVSFLLASAYCVLYTRYVIVLLVVTYIYIDLRVLDVLGM